MLFVPGAIEYNIYLAVQLITLICAICMMVMAASHRPSTGQSVVLLFLFSATVYLLGFTIETLATTVEGYHLACVVEYFGETFVFIAFLHYVSFLCKMNVPSWIYAGQGILSVLINYMVVTTRKNHFFYKDFYVDNNGPFPHLGLVYGPGFFLAIGYIAVLTVVLLVLIVKYIPSANEIERKRSICSILSIASAWLPYVFKLLGLTGGYEIPGPGMVVAGFWLLLTMTKYGFMDSLVLAGERVIENGSYAVIVLNSEYKLEYQNDKMKDIIGTINPKSNLSEYPEIRRILAGNLEPVQVGGKIYDVKLDELKEGNFLMGYMILMFDNTEHYRSVEEIRELASHDSFTGLYNRTTFRKKLESLLSDECNGVFVMMDVDDFKLVNDKYGHAVGDEILLILSHILLSFNEKDLLSCRLGGDEFGCYILNSTDEGDVKDTLHKISNDFKKGLENHGYNKYTSLSIGAVTLTGDNFIKSNPNFDRLYSYADEVMYEVKHSGKGKFFIKNYPMGDKK